MATIIEHETLQVERANASGRTPVVFVHGLWLLPSSWDNWAALFEEAGYAPVTPVWPDDPETVEQARANPEVFAKKTIGQVADHTAEVIGGVTKKPAGVGPSTGGVVGPNPAGRGLSAATVAIDPGPFRGVLPLPVSALKSAGPVLKNPLNKGRAITLTFDQFKYGWANALGDDEAKQLYDTYHVAAPGVALMQMANANRATASQPGRDGDRQGPQPRPLADDRQWLAGGGRHGAAVRAAVHLAAIRWSDVTGVVKPVLRRLGPGGCAWARGGSARLRRRRGCRPVRGRRCPR